MKSKSIGFLLLLIGIFISLIKSGLAPLQSFMDWPFLFFFGGLLLIFIGYAKNNSILTLWGGILATLGISVWGHRHVTAWPTHWSFLIGLLSIAFFIQFVVNRNKITATIGFLLLLVAFFAWPGIVGIPYIAPIAEVINQFWPALLIMIGLIFLVKK
ncbi:hypothetical protein IC620_05455 [Hazenella sp. IB182357]|uniref:DUF5668 domain-containing protein n=1 Tax=Polycladospora coralii TaxID=2771432 RepID=A0A926RU06_9BACL|nr:hypothetical protein [Polycladospora coralii]MBD1371804.1 hypothetical protein [Polycladospora coralii]MBS7529265.1 hypothetical protein [Polycladospora coralii]